MIKIVLIVVCVLIFVGMLALDAYISRDMNRSTKINESENKTEE